MLTASDKAWVAGLVTYVGHLLATKAGLSFVTPELVAILAGAATWWMPNKSP
jgi:hypothetical protein